MKKLSVTLEQKYEIADKLAKQYSTMDKEWLAENRSFAFGIILHTVNTAGQQMIDVLGEEPAIHVTNLVLQRLTGKFQDQVVTDAF